MGVVARKKNNITRDKKTKGDSDNVIDCDVNLRSNCDLADRKLADRKVAGRKLVYANKIIKTNHNKPLNNKKLVAVENKVNLNNVVDQPPNIKYMVSQDLWFIKRLMVLYDQAVDEKIITDIATMRHLWIASALVARLDPVSPVLSFSMIINTRAWYLIPVDVYQWAKFLVRKFDRSTNRSSISSKHHNA
jgi:hypothetical protein